ncbi:acyclic terpene utilization AtuA family protein [Tritonibacter horizontis]|uniref:Terpene utilization protein AtuA n=1 Tax=Tritonibacter horizontis TaxID=1768241 RepID=A0A132C2Q7_9RHOB|nr:acyclic terpene utilization AtuA family protein [Tritonibacter horizontis]KUP94407.1 hypothetical protein TRIHO_07260 [Tritonibacter horizontis]
MSNVLRIGGACGYWGDAAHSTPQLLATGQIDVLVYDYLAEITMAVLARARARDAKAGFVPDFLHDALVPNLKRISDQGVKVITNAGGVNPAALATATREVIKRAGLSLRVAVIAGDDLITQAPELVKRAPIDMFTKAPFPQAEAIVSIHAEIGAKAVAAALEEGADIVITGRCDETALTLGAAIHRFGWHIRDHNYLAGGALAGHVLSGSVQATGGNFTDWDAVTSGIDTLGYPIAEIAGDGSFVLTKPEGTGGLVSRGTVSEQILCEIDNPQSYVVPDVVCDFSEVKVEQIGPDRVQVRGARGNPSPDHYRTCVSWADGFKVGQYFPFYGQGAEQKAERFAEAALAKASAILESRKMQGFSHSSVEFHGSEAQFGALRATDAVRDVVVKIAVRHAEAAGAMTFLKAVNGLAMAAPPGLCGYAGSAPRPTSVLSLFSFLMPKSEVPLTVQVGTDFERKLTSPRTALPEEPKPPKSHVPPRAPMSRGAVVSVPLSRLAWARSGDLGDTVNLGVIARQPEQLPWIWAGLSIGHLERVFGHLMEEGSMTRHFVPGMAAVNITLTKALAGGGTSSLRSDPQGRGFAQLLLAAPISVDWSLLGSSEQ